MLNWFKNEFWFWRYKDPNEFIPPFSGLRDCVRNGRPITHLKKNGKRMLLAGLKTDISVHWFRVKNKKFRPLGWKFYKF